jgi:very-short-patch-repair endonuclease
VIYFKVGKQPIGVIEVDGGYHDQPVQAARDAMKNEILARCGIPILRLRTVESDIQRRIGDFIGQWGSPLHGA